MLDHPCVCFISILHVIDSNWMLAWHNENRNRIEMLIFTRRNESHGVCSLAADGNGDERPGRSVVRQRGRNSRAGCSIFGRIGYTLSMCRRRISGSMAAANQGKDGWSAVIVIRDYSVHPGISQVGLNLRCLPIWIKWMTSSTEGREKDAG